MIPALVEDNVSFLVNARVDVVGRESELRILADWVGYVGRCGGTLLVCGDPGIGKSVLLNDTCARAGRDAVRVLRATGVRSETRVPFAGLHRLLRPLLSQSELLAPQHRETLMTPFGFNERSLPDTFRIAVATLELLAKHADEMPMLIAIDEAQWLDTPTTDVLAFVGRRLGPEPVGLVIATRNGHQAELLKHGLPQLQIAPLDEQSSARLLDARAPDLEPGMRARVLAGARGNPLALLELATAARSPLRQRSVLPNQLALTSRLQEVLLDRFSDLPERTQTLLLVLASDERASLREVLLASASIDKGITMGDLAPAIDARLVMEDYEEIQFRDPLLPMAIYAASTASHRQRVHTALASAVVASRERQTWHRAVSMTGPDEIVASELETTASTVATTQDGTARALAVMELAAHLTPDDDHRQGRLLRAGEFAVELGQIGRASRLLGEIDPAVCNELQRARLELVREICEPELGAGLRTVGRLVNAAELAISAGQADMALSFLEAAAISSWWGDPSVETLQRTRGLAQNARFDQGDPRILSICAICEPQTAATLLRHISSHPARDLVDPNLASVLGAALHAVGAFQESDPFLSVAIAGFRERGCQRPLAQALIFKAWNRIHLGDLTAAADAAREATIVARHTRQPHWTAAAQTAQSMIAAIRGHETTAESGLAEAEALALPVQANGVLADVQLVRAASALGNGRYDEAFQHLQRTFDPRDPAYHRVRSQWRVAEYAEAALHSGRVVDGRRFVAEFADILDLNAPSGLRVRLLYARALLAEDESAEPCFQAAISGELTPWPLYRARLLLEYGTWLRRRRKIAEARMPLRAAREAFVALGACPWAERARQELRASREAKISPPEAWDQLTQQEQQISELAAEGLSNREIAQRLYLSHRTVGSHLYRIFPKLGISSRSQLPAAIRSRELSFLAG